jgi:hypothetical protein
MVQQYSDKPIALSESGKAAWPIFEECTYRAGFVPDDHDADGRKGSECGAG